MKSLEFERISVADVRREIDGQHKRKEEPRRMPQGSSVLLDETSRWIAQLPANVRPIALARKFPRIAERKHSSKHIDRALLCGPPATVGGGRDF